MNKPHDASGVKAHSIHEFASIIFPSTSFCYPAHFAQVTNTGHHSQHQPPLARANCRWEPRRVWKKGGFKVVHDTPGRFSDLCDPSDPSPRLDWTTCPYLPTSDLIVVSGAIDIDDCLAGCVW